MKYIICIIFTFTFNFTKRTHSSTAVTRDQGTRVEVSSAIAVEAKWLVLKCGAIKMQQYNKNRPIKCLSGNQSKLILCKSVILLFLTCVVLTLKLNTIEDHLYWGVCTVKKWVYVNKAMTSLLLSCLHNLCWRHKMLWHF